MSNELIPSKVTKTLAQLIAYVGGTSKGTPGRSYRANAPWITLADGTGLSVQAGEYLYSTPREDFAEFTHVEVGFPSFTPPDSWMEYAEDVERPKGTVYGYIPIELVLDYINSVGIKPI